MGGGGLLSSSSAHWDDVYATKAADSVSWYEPEPATSLRLLRAFARPPASVLDVGAGASLLTDRLLHLGWRDVTVLDVSAVAEAATRARLGEQVSYLSTDVLRWRPARTFGAWHDRAMFHFLTSSLDQAQYVDLATQAVRPGGVVVLGCFAPDGPESCSGLPTARWSAEDLGKTFHDFTLIHSEHEDHVTPAGAVQPFTWAVLRHRG